MEISMGMFLVMVGITGMVLVVISAIVVLLMMANARKRLQKQLDAEYGIKTGS